MTNKEPMYSLDQMKYWLESDNDDAIEWRTSTDVDTMRKVGYMTNLFASTVGGTASSVTARRIQKEQDSAKRELKATTEKLNRRSELEAVAEAKFLANGGTAYEWIIAGPGIVAKLLASGDDAGDTVKRAEAKRRRKSANTWL